MSTEFFEVNGIRVANIKNKSENALFGIAVQAGSNYETTEIAGISHFAEHMFFKGTERRHWSDINKEFAKLGVNNNAYTCNNEVFYHTTCPKENVEPVIDLMLDMFFNSTVPEDEFEKERNVIMEEKKMYDDDPYFAFDSEIGSNLFKWEKGHDVIGTFETLKSIQREDMLKFLKDKTNIKNVLFVCSGDVDSEDLKSYIESRIPENHDYLADGEKNMVGDGFFIDDIDYSKDFQLVYERENITQSQLTMMFKGIAPTDSRYYASSVVLGALGGGMYSKLFSRLREELGLCYRVNMNSHCLSYPDFPLTRMYSFTSPENVDKFVEESKKVIDEVVKNGLDQDIFDCAKADIVGRIVRATETSQGKCSFLLSKYLFTDSKKTFEESMTEIRGVTLEDCNNVVEDIFNSKAVWAVMNPKGE